MLYLFVRFQSTFSAFADVDRLRGLMTVYRHVLVGAFSGCGCRGHAAAQQTVTNEFFESRIRPVLAAKCYACHNSKMKEPKGYLTLDSREGVMKGGTLGPALVPGKPADSKLIHAMKYADPHLQMPPSGKLADEVIADFEAWIAGGAPDPRVDTAGGAVAKRRVVDEAELAEGPAVVGIPGGERAAAAGLGARLERADEARSLRVRQARRERADAVAAGRSIAR